MTEFLSGKAPLNLTVRLGEHMMLIQLQLSPAQVAARRNLRPATSTAAAAPAPAARTAGPPDAASPCERRQRRCPHQRPRGPEDPSAGLRSQLDTRALTEASRNLTRTLKQLSSEVLTGGTDPKDQVRHTHGRGTDALHR